MFGLTYTIILVQHELSSEMRQNVCLFVGGIWGFCVCVSECACIHMHVCTHACKKCMRDPHVCMGICERVCVGLPVCLTGEHRSC